MNIRQKVAVIVMDVAILVELFVSVYLANRDPENFTPIFLKSFLIMVIPTLIAAKIAIKHLRSKEPEMKA